MCGLFWADGRFNDWYCGKVMDADVDSEEDSAEEPTEELNEE